MKNSKATIAIVGIAFVLAIGAMAGRAANAAPTTVPLGTALGYSILAHTTVTNTGPTTVDRSLGIDAPPTSVTGFPPGIVAGAIHAGDAVAGIAKTALTNADLDAAGRASTATYGDLTGLTLVGGVYALSSLASDLGGNLTLNGQNDPSSVWIFKSPSSLITGSTSSVTLTNGASACNVFWQVSSSATLGTGSRFVGTILALTSITVTTGVTIDGRTLARNGAVTLDTDTFVSSGCQPVPAPTTTPAPAATATATPAPSATPIGTAAPTVAPTTAPTTAPTAAPVAVVPTAKPTAVSGAQGLPSTSTGDPSGPLTILGVALAGIGILLLRNRPVPHL
jgi:LPXTG-motif cell wall-anchored protein